MWRRHKGRFGPKSWPNKECDGRHVLDFRPTVWFNTVATGIHRKGIVWFTNCINLHFPKHCLLQTRQWQCPKVSWLTKSVELYSRFVQKGLCTCKQASNITAMYSSNYVWCYVRSIVPCFCEHHEITSVLQRSGKKEERLKKRQDKGLEKRGNT